MFRLVIVRWMVWGAWSSYHLLTVMAPRTMEREKRVEPKRSVPSSCLARLISVSLTLCAF